MAGFWLSYLSFAVAAFGSMAAGSQVVHLYFKPLEDMPQLVSKVKEELRSEYAHLPER